MFMNITGCVILPDGHLLFADTFGKKQLMKYSQDGSYVGNIKLSNVPYDLTIIDSDRIAISYGNECFIEIFDLCNNTVENSITTEGRCFGIVYYEGRLYVTVQGIGIIIMDLSGNLLNTIERDSEFIADVIVDNDRILYSDYIENTVTCCNLNGEEIWVFNEDAVERPQGLAIDNNRNIFVAGTFSGNLTVISSNGKHSKTLLTATDGLNSPRAVYFDKSNSVLLVCDENETVAIFEVLKC